MRKPKFVQHLVIGGLSLVIATGTQAVAATVPVQKPTIDVIRISNLVLTPGSLTGGGQATGVVTLEKAASGSVAVALRSSNAQVAAVPQSVVVQPGATSATFIVQTYPVAANPNVVTTSSPSVQISAQFGAFPPKVVDLTVVPATLTSLALNPASVAGGNNVTGTVTISGPAPSGGLTIALSNTAASASPASQRVATPFQRAPVGIIIPPQVVIAAGATSATFPINTRPVSASTTFQINASWGAFVTKTAALTVLPPDLASLTVTPGQQFGGNSSSATATLSAQAPSEGLALNLQTGRASGGTTGTFAQCGQFPSVPSTVTVAGGATSAQFTVTTYPGYGVYWVSAASATASKSQAFYVDAPFFKPVLPSSVKGGMVAQGTIQLTGPAMPVNCSNRYTVVSSNTNFAQVPAYVDVTPGATQAALPVTTSALPANAAPVTVTISATGIVVNNGVPTPGHQTYSANLTITP
jgi:hypothetical protein